MGTGRTSPTDPKAQRGGRVPAGPALSGHLRTPGAQVRARAVPEPRGRGGGGGLLPGKAPPLRASGARRGHEGAGKPRTSRPGTAAPVRGSAGWGMFSREERGRRAPRVWGARGSLRTRARSGGELRRRAGPERGEAAAASRREPAPDVRSFPQSQQQAPRQRRRRREPTGGGSPEREEEGAARQWDPPGEARPGDEAAAPDLRRAP